MIDLNYRVNLDDYRDVKRVAGEMAAELGWRLGQDPEGGIVIKRGPGTAPKPFKSWLGAYTWLRDILIDRRASAPIAKLVSEIPVAQHAPPIPVAQLLPPVPTMRPAPPPMARVVEVDAAGRIVRYVD